MGKMHNGVELIGLDDDTQEIKDLAASVVIAHKAKKGFCPDPHSYRLKKMRCNVLTSARLFEERLSLNKGRNSTHKAAMITLTYAEDNFDANDIRDFLTNVRNYLSRLGHDFYYVWVAELQRRGVLHYHVVCYLPRCKNTGKFLKLPKPDDRGWWKKGSSNVCWAKFAPGYLAKYASKITSKEEKGKYPKGARISGTGGLTKSERIEVKYHKLPKFVKDVFPKVTNIDKVTGGYVVRDTGVFLESPWHFAGFIGSGRPFFVCYK